MKLKVERLIRITFMWKDKGPSPDQVRDRLRQAGVTWRFEGSSITSGLFGLPKLMECTGLFQEEDLPKVTSPFDADDNTE